MIFSHLYAMMKHNGNMINKHIFTITLKHDIYSVLNVIESSYFIVFQLFCLNISFLQLSHVTESRNITFQIFPRYQKYVNSSSGHDVTAYYYYYLPCARAHGNNVFAEFECG